MAIEIAPRGKIKLPFWLIVLGVFAIILLIGFLGSYFYLEISIKKMSQEIQEKGTTLTPLIEAIEKKEEELNPIEKKIDDFGELLQKHKIPLNIFNFLEKICLPAVWFSDFNFTSEEREVIVSGHTDTFVILEQQILVLKQDPLVKSLNISGVSISEEGKVDFTFLLTFAPQIFTPLEITGQ